VLVFSTFPTSDLLQLELPETLPQIHILKVLKYSSARSSCPWHANPGMLVRLQPLVLALTCWPHQPAQLHRQPMHLKLHVVAAHFGSLVVQRHCNQSLLSPSQWLTKSSRSDRPLSGIRHSSWTSPGSAFRAADRRRDNRDGRPLTFFSVGFVTTKLERRRNRNAHRKGGK